MHLCSRRKAVMSAGVYHFKIGSFNCIELSHGTFTYPSSNALLFANAAYEELRAREQHPLLEQWTSWISPYTCLVIDTGRHRVLVDTGAGTLGPDTGHLVHTLVGRHYANGDRYGHYHTCASRSRRWEYKC